MAASLFRVFIPACILSSFFLTPGCTPSNSEPTDIKIGGLVIDDAFVSLSTRAIIEGALSEGCADFQFDASTKTRCANAFARLTELLDFKAATSGDHSAFVFLHSQLIKNTSSDDGKNYLNSLANEISKTYASGAPLRLWEFSLSHFKGDAKKTITHIASLFQDTLPTEAQTKWLLITNEGDASTLQNILTDIDALTKSKLIQFYPQGVESSRSAFYHFYIPMYFANEMKFHFTKKDMAFLTAFLFNARYEFRQIWENSHPQDKVNYNVSDGFARRKALVADLLVHLKGPILPFDSTKEPGNFDDLYLGYAGAKMGLDGVFTKEDSDAFKKSFASNPVPFIKTAFAAIR